MLQWQCILVLKHLVYIKKYPSIGIKTKESKLELNVTQPYWQAASPTVPTSNVLIPDPSWSQGETQRFNLCCLQLCLPSFPQSRCLQTQHRCSHSVYQTKAFKMSIIIFFASFHCFAASHNPECASHGCICQSQFFQTYFSAPNKCHFERCNEFFIKKSRKNIPQLWTAAGSALHQSVLRLRHIFILFFEETKLGKKKQPSTLTIFDERLTKLKKNKKKTKPVLANSFVFTCAFW